MLLGRAGEEMGKKEKRRMKLGEFGQNSLEFEKCQVLGSEMVMIGSEMILSG
jgi:hypothetical protein